jgi:hypothetical protein
MRGQLTQYSIYTEQIRTNRVSFEIKYIVLFESKIQNISEGKSGAQVGLYDEPRANNLFNNFLSDTFQSRNGLWCSSFLPLLEYL